MEESGKVEKLKGDDATNEIDDEALNALLVALNGETNEALNEMETDANVEITASCVDLPDALWDCLGNVLDATASESKTRAQTAEDIVRCIEERGPPREVVMMATANQQTKPPQDDEHDTFAERIRLIEPFAHHFLGIRASQFIAERGVQLANWGLSMGEKGCLADIRSDGVHEKALANLAVALANYASSHPVAERRADAVKCLIRAFDLVCGPAVPGSSGGLALLRSVYERCFFVPPKALAIDHVRRHVASTWNKDLCETVADFSVSQLEAFASGSSGDLEMHADLVISFLVLTRLLAARHHFADSDLCTRAVAASKNLARSITQAQSELYTVSAMDTSNTSAPHEGACKHSHQQCQHPHKNADAVQSNALVIEDAPFRPPPPPTRSIAQRGMHLALLEDANSLALAAMSQREN
ncbi:Hypothetical Protein FCC1311_087282 [Hondaea fermentalgiana]|uniref:Uncharacterized protein n=1 Tax=Hondaea fermentalgiana TaxID=2315210 RepID=A0A2R5GV25_9STRA|nr:Hypothetical Protein FCC1311_087282 [Hondaea fermentalgiana]|eukprot:GBG32503.1 Hypothetical Protein FCC1311_087282 [Hondaea fermentalgiana]